MPNGNGFIETLIEQIEDIKRSLEDGLVDVAPQDYHVDLSLDRPPQFRKDSTTHLVWEAGPGELGVGFEVLSLTTGATANIVVNRPGGRSYPTSTTGRLGVRFSKLYITNPPQPGDSLTIRIYTDLLLIPVLPPRTASERVMVTDEAGAVIVPLQEDTFTGRLGEVSPNPTSNTVLARLKNIFDKLNSQLDVLLSSRAAASQLPSALSGSGNLKTAVSEPLPTGANVIGKVRVDGLDGVLTRVSFSVSAAGNNTIIAGVSGQRIRLYKLVFKTEGTQTVGVLFGSTHIYGANMTWDAKSGIIDENFNYPLIGGLGEALIINLGTGGATFEVRGYALYTQS